MSTGGRSEARRKAVAVGPGVCHALGLMMLVISEWVRADLKDATSLASRGYLKDMIEFTGSLADTDWYKPVVDLYDKVSFGEPRAALWAAVFIALVVRLNRYGPEEAQWALSWVAAAYCALATLALLPYLAAPGAGGALLLLALSGGLVHMATR
ncbi:hypothetical protein AB0B12_04065 [Streptomyces sp. NPDC044780]|uniref:Uncharacterized protein n=1 Tax=Streptomyces luomodiensis TaxID=3026192 RepID=A0ABY9V1L1_9ACTN|nr:hypothetical protein [Streptomyces sp. SCA4-21]WNE98471.1 hypothetical protein PS467_25630 [Streptomyces sp. SCA4-21]